MLYLLIEKQGSIFNLDELGNFILQMVDKNTNVYNLLLQNFARNLKREEIVNVFASILVNGVDFLEKMYTSYGQNFLQNNMVDTFHSFETEKSKLKQAIGLPSITINFIKDIYSDLYGDFKDLCEKRSHDDAVILTEHLIYVEKVRLKSFENVKMDEKTLKTDEQVFNNNVKAFVKNVVSIALNCETSMTVIINYLYVQSFTYLDMYSIVSLPVSMSITMKDYICISIKNDLPFERLPSNMKAAHYYLLENVKYQENEEKQKSFEAAVEKYRFLESFDKTYSVLAPKTITDMIKEGNDLKHCIANYVDNVIGGSKVLFCRKSDEIEKSFVSFEIDDDLNFIQIKEKFDMDVVDADMLAYLMKWKDRKMVEKNKNDGRN